jgi:hypothetical protein
VLSFLLSVIATCMQVVGCGTEKVYQGTATLAPTNGCLGKCFEFLSYETLGCVG